MFTLFSPAKINLFLRVVCRRPDGYHELASLFQAITLGDTIQFALADYDALTCSEPNIPTDHSNLILKAANLFRRKTGYHVGLKVHLHKRIPMQAGLGGGSSNAATTLWALNKLCNLNIPDKMLAEWSTEIGSDIPFFFSCGAAYCTGRGEQLQEVPTFPQTQLWIVKPTQGLSTPEVYKHLRLNDLTARDPLQALQKAIAGHPIYFNDLEQPAFELMPALKTMKEKLTLLGFSTVMMTGSGSGFFCIGEASRAYQEGCFCHSAQFINRSKHEWYSEPIR